MKKLLLAGAAALLIAGSASAAQWAVVGAYSNPNWNFEASTVMTGEGDDFSCTIEYLTNDFKIVDIENNNWDTQYGTSTPIEINTPIVLNGKNGGADPANMSFAGLIQAVKNAQVKWNPSTATMEIVASQSDLVIEYPTLYVTGSFNDWPNPPQNGGVLMSETDGIYTATLDLGDSGNVTFKVAGAGWANEIAGGVTVTDDAAVPVTKGGSDLETTLTGTQTLTFNYNTMMMTFGDASLTEAEPAHTWAVVGSYTNPAWNFEASTVLTGEGDDLSCTIDYLTTDFKIVDITYNNWDTSYGLSDKLKVNTPTVLDFDGANIAFADLVQAVNNATVKWNPTTCTVEVVAEESDLVVAYPVLYVTGSFCDWANPGEEGTVLMAREDAIYSATFDLGESGDVEFKLAGDGWSNQIGGGVEVGTEATDVTEGGENLKTTLTGTQTLTFNLNTLKMTFGDPTTVGVNTIEAEANEAPVYFNLQGIRVANPQNGIFIVKKGNKVTKVVK